jgi:hypothetical protein
VTAVARLLPRHWDGRRLLQFMTGLALIALAFAAPALTGSPAVEPAQPGIGVITTIDTPPAPELPAEPGLAGRVEIESPAAAALSSDGGQSTDGHSTDGQRAGQPAGLPVDVARSGTRICVEAGAPARGTTRGARGERAPPRI